MTKRRKATQKWQQLLSSKDTVEYEELNAEVYENVGAGPHWEDSIGWHMHLPRERKLKTGYARAWARRLLWRYGINLEGATRDTLYREAYRLYEDAVERANEQMLEKFVELLGPIPSARRYQIEEGTATQEEYYAALAAQKEWYGKLYAIRNATGLTGNWGDFDTDYEVTFKKKDSTIEDI